MDYYNSEGYKKRAKEIGISLKSPLKRIFGIKDKVGYLPNTKIEDSQTLNGKVVIGLIASDWDPHDYYDMLGFTTVHELSHFNRRYNRGLFKRKSDESPYYGNNYRKVPQYYKDLLKSNVTNPHDQEINENYSNLIGLRYLLNKYGYFNSNDPNANFDQNLLNQIKGDERIYGNPFLNMHTDDQIIKSINDVASNNSKDNDNLV